MNARHRTTGFALFSSLTLIASSLFAADREYPTNPERGLGTESPPTEKTRAVVLAEQAEFLVAFVTPNSWRSINPERNFIAESPPAARTRAEVLAEFDEYRRNPVTPDGWRDVGGERGFVPTTSAYGFAEDNFAYGGNWYYNCDGPTRILTADAPSLASLASGNTR